MPVCLPSVAHSFCFLPTCVVCHMLLLKHYSAQLHQEKGNAYCHVVNRTQDDKAVGKCEFCDFVKSTHSFVFLVSLDICYSRFSIYHYL